MRSSHATPKIGDVRLGSVVAVGAGVLVGLGVAVALAVAVGGMAVLVGAAVGSAVCSSSVGGAVGAGSGADWHAAASTRHSNAVRSRVNLGMSECER